MQIRKTILTGISLTALALSATVQTVLADSSDGALAGVSGVNNSYNQSGNSTTPTINVQPGSLKSYGGAGFDFDGDLVSRPITLVEVPNFDFGALKIGETSKNLDKKGTNRYLVVNDQNANPGTQTNYHPWNVDVKLGKFSYKNKNNQDIPLSTKYSPQIVLKATGLTNKRTRLGTWVNNTFIGSGGSTVLNGFTSNVILKSGDDTTPSTVMSVTGNKYEAHAYAIDFNDPSYATLQNFPSTKININDTYTAPLTWTLSVTA
ncbi:WxL domain-containing protein [Bombilactobacillus folatiphilus]|uniref:WxL domain-containing protein n=1 Tax=Bombilactobacillus folatiphilus TaxID=2923362 RepID=A0ABY4P8A6_9LACO|nr:WxL domain-containing protein [Bombilactobacillus folatiphilus]UQS81854.1 WxL domain-containing protein [Bombilactobacillus folatiphilus]